MSAFWKSISIPLGETRRWEIGLLDLWIHHGAGEWRVWHRIENSTAREGRYLLGEKCSEPEGHPERRYAFESSTDLLRLEPSFPDRPIVSYPALPIFVPAKSEARFICGIPLWVKLLVGSGDEEVHLATIPLRNLSKTWFGTALEGESCFSASTRAVLNHLDLDPNKHRALCPVKVTNRTGNPLPIERICIHVEHLQLLEGASYLWTNEVFVNKESEHETSRVTYGKGAPRIDPDAELKLNPKVVPPSDSLFLKTFNHLRTVLGD